MFVDVSVVIFFKFFGNKVVSVCFFCGIDDFKFVDVG